MKNVILVLVLICCYFEFCSSEKTSPSVKEDLKKKSIYDKPIYKKRDEKVDEEEEEEEEEEIAEENDSEYEDEYGEESSPGFQGGIMLGLDPWKMKEEEKRVRNEQGSPPFGFGKSPKVDGEIDYESKLFPPGEIYKDVPFKYPKYPKDIYKEEKERKVKETPFYGGPFLFGVDPKVYEFKPSIPEDSDEEDEKKIDPKFLYREYLFGGHFFPKIPPYLMNPELFRELLSKELKFKSGSVKEASDIKKDVAVESENIKESVAVYKADNKAVKAKSIKPH